MSSENTIMLSQNPCVDVLQREKWGSVSLRACPPRFLAWEQRGLSAGLELIFKIMGYFPSDATWSGWLGWHLMSPTVAAQQMLLCPRGRGVKSALHLTQAIETQPCTGSSLKQMSWMQTGLLIWYSPSPVCKPHFRTSIEWGWWEGGRILQGFYC